MEWAIFNTQDLAEVDIMLNAMVAFKSALGALVPVPSSIGPLAPENALRK